MKQKKREPSGWYVLEIGEIETTMFQRLMSDNVHYTKPVQICFRRRFVFGIFSYVTTRRIDIPLQVDVATMRGKRFISKKLGYK